MKRAILGTVLLAGTAHADPAAPDYSKVDLVLHHAPARLHMRVKQRTATTSPDPTPTPAPTGAKPTEADDDKFHPLPTSVRDFQQRVMFKINAGYELDSAPASGDTLRGGTPLAPGFAGTRQWVTGDAMVGARDILLPSLGGYFLAGYQFDAGNELSSNTAWVVPGDATGQRFAVKAGYAEYQTEDGNDNHFWARAGRQYRIDGGSMFAYFDGGAIGYRSGGVSVSAFGGERAVLYVDTPAGQTFGATAEFDLKKLANVPVKVGLDYMGLLIGINDGMGSINGVTDDVKDNQFRSLLAASGNIDISPAAHLDLRARAVDGGTGIDFGRADARLRYAITHDVMMVLDVSQRGSGDLAYDLASPTQVDVVDLSRRLGVGLVAPTDSTLAGAHLDWRHGNKELLVFGQANLAEGTVTSVDQESWFEGGAAIAGAPVRDLWATLQYTFRDYLLKESANVLGSAFDDTAGSGLGSMHELALDAWWRSPDAKHRWRIGAGGFYRVYDFSSPYETTTDEGRGGGRADISYMLTTALHIMVNGEVAQSSPTVMREIGTLSSFRVALEARW